MNGWFIKTLDRLSEFMTARFAKTLKTISIIFLVSLSVGAIGCVSYVVAPVQSRTYYSIALVISALVGLGVAYQIYDQKKYHKEAEQANQEVLERLDTIAKPQLLKADLALFFIESDDRTSELTISPTYMDINQVRKHAEAQYPKSREAKISGNILAGLFYDPVASDKQRQYKIDKAEYDAVNKRACKVQFEIENKGELTASDVSVLIDLPKGLIALAELPEPPKEPSSWPSVLSPNYKLPNINPLGPWVSEENEVEYHIAKIKPGLREQLPTVYIAGVNKDASYEITFRIVPENTDTKNGHLTLIVKPRKE